MFDYILISFFVFSWIFGLFVWFYFWYEFYKEFLHLGLKKSLKDKDFWFFLFFLLSIVFNSLCALFFTL
jgi:hypothetical protein